MSDLAKRLLRKHNPTFVESINGKPFQVPVNPDGAEAAALIEAQDERIKALEAGLNKEERQHITTIDQRDAAESAIGRAYQSVTGNDPEWSNHFTLVDAVEAIENTVSDLRHAASLLEAKP